MICKEIITLENEGLLYGKPAIKTLTADCNISARDDEVRFDLNLQNHDLYHRGFKITAGTLIRHSNDIYRVTGDSIAKGRPHHVVCFARKIKGGNNHVI